VPERYSITPETHEAVVEAFLDGAVPVSAVAFSVSADAPPLLFLVDPAVARLVNRAEQEGSLEGRWGALVGDPGVLRFDAFTGKRPLGSWLVPFPSQGFIRAGSSGAHVVLVPERFSDDPEEAEEQWARAIQVPVEKVEAIRSLVR
jgi:hypothetical protein